MLMQAGQQRGIELEKNYKIITTKLKLNLLIFKNWDIYRIPYIESYSVQFGSDLARFGFNSDKKSDKIRIKIE